MNAGLKRTLGPALGALLAARSGAGLEQRGVGPAAPSAGRNRVPPAPSEEAARVRAEPGQSLLSVMNVVVMRRLPKLVDDPATRASRASFKNGLLGLGAYEAPGGSFAGLPGPPLHLFPRAGLGQSLGRDPTTGRSYLGLP